MGIDPELLIWAPRSTVAVPSTYQVTLVDWARRMDPDGRIESIMRLLSETNDILGDMTWR
jgi:hypothetical protein